MCDCIDLAIPEGEFFFILGPSGCGKSTLLRMIAGLLDPDDGSIFLRNSRINDLPPYKRDINTVFQHYALFPHLSVFDNVAFGLKMKGLAKPDIAERVEAMLKLVKLQGYNTRKPGQLSGGQQQRVALARALVNKPQVLLFDEPLSALDVKLRKQMQLELRHLQRTLGMTFVYVTHDQEEALTMADRIAVMKDGRIEQIGSPARIYNQPRTRFVADFIGESNFFESETVQFRNGHALMSLDEQATVRAQVTNGFKPDDALVFMVRPEKIKMQTNSLNGQPEFNHLSGRLEEIIYLGTVMHYMVRLHSGHPVKVLEQNLDRHTPYEIGQEIHLKWAVDHTIILHQSEMIAAGEPGRPGEIP